MTETKKRIFLWGGFVFIIALAIGIIVNLATPHLSVITTKISDSDNIIGDKSSKIVLVEYSDFQCPACKVYSSVLKSVALEFENHIVFTYRYFPLRKMHPNAVLSAQVAQAAAVQGKFWEMHDKLFENQEKWSKFSQTEATAEFKVYAQEIGLDVNKFETDLNSNQVIAKISADEKSGQDAKLNHTPTFFLDGKEVINPKNIDDFRKLIREEIAANNPQN